MKVFSTAVYLSLLYYAGMPAQEFVASHSPITPEILSKMSYSWKDNNPVPVSDLRCVSVSYHGFDDTVHQGSLIVHAKVAEEIIDIFKEIFEDKFPIEKIAFVDVYEGIDEKSAADNNTYAFCSRPITGTTGTFSRHSYGLAIDINPLYNPYQQGTLIVPQEGSKYLDRQLKAKGMIHRDSVCYKAFIKRGWKWGGDWHSVVDYQHFEKDPAQVQET